MQFNAVAAGSTPAFPATYGELAQLVEHEKSPNLTLPHILNFNLTTHQIRLHAFE